MSPFFLPFSINISNFSMSWCSRYRDLDIYELEMPTLFKNFMCAE